MQSEWVAVNKNRHVRDSYSRAEQEQTQVIWPWLLSAHALHHGALVYLITQRPSLGLAEAIVHWCSDFAKCEKWYGFHTDQLVHIGSKLVWTTLATWSLV